MDPVSITEDTERTWFCPQTGRQMDWTRWNQYTPLQLLWEVGTIKQLAKQTLCSTDTQKLKFIKSLLGSCGGTCQISMRFQKTNSCFCKNKNSLTEKLTNEALVTTDTGNEALVGLHLWIKSTSFNVWVRYFVWNFKGTLWNSTQNILPIHWKIWFLYNMEILRAPGFKSSYVFLNPPSRIPHYWDKILED